MFKLAQDAGHGRYTAGKRCDERFDPNETREWVLNDRVARKVAKLLTENYEDVEILRVDDVTGETDVDFHDRPAIANAWGANMYQSYHFNAGVKGGKGGGIVIYVQKKPTQTELEWQKELYDALVAETGLKGNRSEPLGKRNFVVIRDAEMDAVLMELGFMDSAVDTPIILTEEYADQCARAIAAVTARRAKLPPKGTGSSGSGSEPENRPEPIPDTLTIKSDDVVQLLPGATYYSGKAIPDWVLKKNWIVMSVSGNRAVIDKSEDGKHSILSPVHTDNLKLVAAAPESTPKPETPIRLDCPKEKNVAYDHTYIVDSYDGVLSLRAGASADKQLIEEMENGQTFRCYGYHTGNWLYGVAQSGKKGFCHKNYVKKV